jgi:hypothetical protein
MYILASYCNYDDMTHGHSYEKDPETKRARKDDADPGLKRDAESARYQKGPESKRVGEHKRYLDHAETRAVNILGLI